MDTTPPPGDTPVDTDAPPPDTLEQLRRRALSGAVGVARVFAELRDLETAAHLDRVAGLARRIAERIGPARGHDREWIERLHLVAPLHDIGKVGIPDAILLKPGALDPDEWAVMQTHTTLGERMVVEMAEGLEMVDPEELAMMRNVTLLHHETLDGGGYPLGLRGAEIPDEARIMVVADVYDALLRPRPYKQGWERSRVHEHLRELVVTGRLDGDCVEALLDHPSD